MLAMSTSDASGNRQRAKGREAERRSILTRSNCRRTEPLPAVSLASWRFICLLALNAQLVLGLLLVSGCAADGRADPTRHPEPRIDRFAEAAGAKTLGQLLYACPNYTVLYAARRTDLPNLDVHIFVKYLMIADGHRVHVTFETDESGNIIAQSIAP